MRNNPFTMKHQRGSSPPFHKSERGFDDWVRNLRSIDQHPYDLSEIQSLKEQVALRKKSVQDPDSLQQSIKRPEPQQILEKRNTKKVEIRIKYFNNEASRN